MGLSTWFKQSERYLRSFRVIWRNVSNCGVKMQKKWHKIGFLKNKNLNFFKSLKWFWTIFQHYFTRINKNSEKRNVGELSGGEFSVRGNSPEGNSPWEGIFRGEFSRGSFSWGDFSEGGIILKPFFHRNITSDRVLFRLIPGDFWFYRFYQKT